MDNLGIYLIVISVIFIIGRTFSKNKKNVRADNGSVAVGDNNFGKIKVTHKTTVSRENLFWRGWDITVGVIGILGFLLILWPLK